MVKKSKMPTRDEFVKASDGKTVKESAALYGVSTSTIQIWRARLRVRDTNRSHPLTERELLGAGAGRRTDAEVAATLGTPASRVGYWRRVYGIPGNPKVWRKLERMSESSGVLTVRLYSHERRELKDRSEQAGLSVSEYVRGVLFGDGGTDE